MLILSELALEHVEAKANMQLSRQIGTPNISSKGKLEPRSVLIPNALLDPSQPLGPKSSKKPKALVQELTTELKSQKETDLNKAQNPKSILKQNLTSTKSKTPMIQELDEVITRHSGDSNGSPSENLPPPRWKWTDDGDRIKIDIDVPTLVSGF